MGTLGGLNRLDPETGLITRYLRDEKDPRSLLNDIVRSILIDSENRLWIGTLEGIDLYNDQSDAFIHYAYDPENPSGLPGPYVMKIIEDERDSLLIGTWGGGLTRFNMRTETFETFPLADNRVYSLEKDKEGNIWIGTWGGGIFIFNSEDNSLTNLRSDENQRTSLSSDTVYSLFNDQSGIMWVGTNGKGISKHNYQKKDYSFLSHSPLLKNTIDSGKVESLMEDKEGNLWIGIYNGGINLYNPVSGEMKYYRHDETDRSSLSNDIISEILEDKSGNIWISTNEGLNLYQKETDNFKRFLLDPEEDLHATYTYTELYEDSKGHMWIGSHNKGLFRYEPETGKIENFSSVENDENSLSDNLVNTIIERKNGQFWVGTNKGLNLMDRESGTFKRYLVDRENPKGLNNNAIRTLHEDSNGQLWIGTGGGGINLYDDKNKSFRHITNRDGLSNNFIMSMEESIDKKIWAGTKYGITIIDINSGNIKTLYREDGLNASEFTSGSLTLSDKSIFLSSINEIYRFESSLEVIPLSKPVVHIDSFEVGGKKKPGISPYHLTESVTLNFKDSTYLSFHYVALSYLNPENIIYAHKLEGFDDDWIIDNDRRYALYTNLQPGNYSFRVKASAGDDLWVESDYTPQFTIKPPLSRTGLAYFIYLILFVSLMYLLISFRTNYIKIQKLSALKIAESKYRQLSSSLNNILNAMPSVLIVVDDTLQVTRWNSGAVKETGITEEKAKGKNLSDVYPSLPMELSIIKESLISGRTISERKRINPRNQSMRYENITVFPISTNGISEAVIRIDDVTTHVQMEEILIQSEKMLSVGGLAAGMAHEINNPLAGMIQNAAVLKNRLGDSRGSNANNKAALKAGTTMQSIESYISERDIPRILDNIELSGRRISTIVSNMLSFAQKKSSQKELFNIPDLIEKTIELAASDYDLKKQYDFRSISIKREIQDSMPPVLCESSKIQQVILNILRNGAEAMHETNIKNPQFIFRLYIEKKGKAVLEIENNGPAIAKEIQKRIFEPFYTTKPVGIGTGLGLSISYFIIVENHKGEIEVESEKTGGVKFIIRLPL
jgi:PAS domain S-box-containing protein